ncbi:MAG: hypothetical protein K6A62_01255 [Bacteroidales bacterium]|nr:hypothetical protein [Bacteroidales bacterium]
MSSFEVKSMGLEEVSISETIATNGGAAFVPWWPIVKAVLEALGDLAMGFAAGWAISKAISESNAEEYYGGELEPAICIG